MTTIFLSGALRGIDVLCHVLRRKPATTEMSAALLPGFREQLQDPAAHPALLSAAGQELEGRVISVSPQELAQVTYYMGCFGAQPQTAMAVVKGAEQQVTVFVAASSEEQVGAGEMEPAVRARMAHDIMAFEGRKTADQITRSLYAMRIRAWSWVYMQSGDADPNRDLSQDVIVHDHRIEYMNFFAMEEMELQYRRFDGTLSPVINRGASIIGQAAVVLPYDPGRDAVLLIEQFRSAPYFMGDKRPWVWEPPAGLVDPGETPEQAARREAKEEAGLEVTHLDYVGGLYSSTGALGERVHCFVGLADVAAIVGGGGVPGEGEDIRSKVMSFHELMEAVDKNTFVDMPLMTTALWLARHRDRLRGLWR